jgi:hypothetical protein
MTVEQVDRDAAADLLDQLGWDWGACGDVRAGRTSHPAVQAFARHREQARAEAIEQAAGVLRDAAVKLAVAAGKLNVALDGQGKYRHHRQAVLEAMRELEAALPAPPRSLSAAQGG